VWLRHQYQEYRLQRAKRKFQVYLRKKSGDNDKFVH